MPQEIERKFLVAGQQYKQLATKAIRIKQGYLSSAPERIVRVRTYGEKAFITVKGQPLTGEFARFEWEKEITLPDAEALLILCEKGIIDKTRYLIPNGNHTIEVDEFYGENRGLIIAEIELKSEDEPFFKPNWVGKEVTGESRYYNSALARLPFLLWD